MPRNPDRKRIEVLFSPAQHEVLARIASEQRVDVAELVRQAILERYPAIPDDLPARGKYKRSVNSK